MRARILSGLGVAVLLTGVTFGWAQKGPDRPRGPEGGPPAFEDGIIGGLGLGPQHGPGLGQWWNHKEIQEKLELSEEQVSQLSKKRVEVEKGMIEGQAKLKIARLELHELIRDKSSTAEVIDSKVDEVGNAVRDLVKSMVQQRLAFRDILNDDQLGKIENFMSERKHRMGDRFWGDRGRGGQRGDGPPWMHGDRDRGPEGKDRGRGPEGKDRGDDRRGNDKMKPNQKGEGPEGPPHRRREFGEAPDGPPPFDGPPPGPEGRLQGEGPMPGPDDRFGGPLPPPGGFPPQGTPGAGPEFDLPPRPMPPQGVASGEGEPLPELGEALDSLMADFQ